MSEQQKYIPESEISQNEWIKLNEIPDYDYWIGANYKGQYKDRLELNVTTADQICRYLNFPPLSIESNLWNPPAEQEPEMVSRGLAAWKKKVFMGKNDVERSQDDQYSKVEGSNKIILAQVDDEHFLPLDLGYKIKINDRQIDYDFSIANPNSTREEGETNFINKFNDSLWTGFHGVARKERSDYRAMFFQSRSGEDSVSNAISLFSGVGTDLGFASLGYLNTNVFGHMLAQWGIASLYQVPVGEIKDKMRKIQDKSENRISLAFSNFWRSENFPDRFEQEVHGFPAPYRQLLRLIPFSSTRESFYRLEFLKIRSKEPLVRLSK